jgi:predicted Zn-dependent protease
VKISNDPRLTAPLLRVGKAISAAANKPEYEWEFKLIDDIETINAWCMPGGKIAFYTGIYPILHDEAGMAIVMGHEVMHAILQHGNERMSQGAAAQAGLAVSSVLLSDSKYKNEQCPANCCGHEPATRTATRTVEVPGSTTRPRQPPGHGRAQCHARFLLRRRALRAT